MLDTHAQKTSVDWSATTPRKRSAEVWSSVSDPFEAATAIEVVLGCMC